MKVYLCRCRPFNYISAYFDIALAREWWKRNEDSYGTREIRVVRWDQARSIQAEDGALNEGMDRQD